MNTVGMRRLRWTVRQYSRLSELGFLDDRRAELINGDIITGRPQEHPHLVCVSRLARLLLGAFSPTYWVVIRGTLVLPPHNAPDPDFHVFDAPVGTPDNRLPVPLLVIEVSDQTYGLDSGANLAYSRAGISDYWIVNLAKQQVEVCRQPENPTGKRSGWRYASTSAHGSGEILSPLHRPDLGFPVDQMLA
jgi:Uma2 family endonuclease